MRLTILEISTITGILFALMTSITVVLEFKKTGNSKKSRILFQETK